ncbi:hypothetical protein CIPAW_07G231800 [Carya illinoinensis]|uniref:Cytochrome b5 heme-binding domain-containing protein n=1 Tax=Carya illinoinensis TaxID=32201 RepID=A0A8T1PZK3_CARIL|nr:hypothetical protein CIPAW_07G231800 [Carya illinoinensis]
MELTAQQLSEYNGTDPSKPIYVAVKGRIFDVTNGKSFYGPGGSYAMFAGKDASRALAKMSKNDEDVSPSLDGLSEKEIGVLNDWEKKFEAKYPVEAFGPKVIVGIVSCATARPGCPFEVPST